MSAILPAGQRNLRKAQASSAVQAKVRAPPGGPHHASSLTSSHLPWRFPPSALPLATHVSSAPAFPFPAFALRRRA